MAFYQFRLLILPIFPWIQSELKTKTALLHLQNGFFECVPPQGPVPNRFVEKFVTSTLRAGMIISISEIVKERWHYLLGEILEHGISTALGLLQVVAYLIPTFTQNPSAPSRLAYQRSLGKKSTIEFAV